MSNLVVPAAGVTVASLRKMLAQFGDDMIVTGLRCDIAAAPAPSAPPTRDELLALCRDGVVPQDEWADRDSAAVQRQLGACRALIEAGCDFYVIGRRHDHWGIGVTFRGFNAFEYGDDAPDQDEFYVPTRERLDMGGDWY